MAYIDQYTLGEDVTFQHRIQVAALTSALAIQGEAKGGFTDQQYSKRQELAHRVVVDPSGYARMFARLVVTGASVTSGTSDATLQTIVTNNWDKAAAVDVTD